MRQMNRWSKPSYFHTFIACIILVLLFLQTTLFPVVAYANEETRCKVTIETNGGSTPQPPSLIVTADDYITQIPKTEREGFVFAGWYKDISLKNRWDFGNDRVTGNLFLYGKWEKKLSRSHRVFFDSDGGSTIPYQVVTAGGKADAPLLPQKPGFGFAGWYRDMQRSTVWDFATDIPQDETILYAKWSAESVSYNVNFETNGGNAIESIKVVAGALIPAPAPPIKSGFKFTGWYTNPETTQAWSLSTDTVQSNMTLYAGWQADPEIFTVSFQSNGGSFVPSVQVVSGEKAAEPIAPIKPGNVFTGWYRDVGTSNAWNFATDIVTDNITLYAGWTPETTFFQVTFNSNGGTSVSNATVEEGGVVSEPNPPVKPGFNFSGWHKDYPPTIPWNFATDTVENDITLYAKWVAEPQIFTVTFDSQGGSYVPPETVPENMNATRPIEPVKPGYVFAGWYADSGMTFPWNFENQKIISDVTIYAGWSSTRTENGQGTNAFSDHDNALSRSLAVHVDQENEAAALASTEKKKNANISQTQAKRSVTVNYDLADGVLPEQKSVIQVTVDTDSKINLQDKTQYPGTPTRSGYVFSGWTVANNGTIFDFGNTSVAHNLFLVASWTKDFDGRYDLFYRTMGGDMIQPLYGALAGQPIELPEAVRAGYQFDGWYREPELQTPFESTAMPSESIILYAKWKRLDAVPETGDKGFASLLMTFMISLLSLVALAWKSKYKKRVE